MAQRNNADRMMERGGFERGLGSEGVSAESPMREGLVRGLRGGLVSAALVQAGLVQAALVPAALLMVAGAATAVRAQDGAGASSPAAGSTTGGTGEAGAGTGAGAAEEAKPAARAKGTAGAVATPPGAATGKPITFNFKDAPFDQVFDFLSRESGVPVIREAEAPKAPVTFISGAEYSLDESLDIVNRLLWMHGLQLRREENFLLLAKLEDMRARSRQFAGQLPESVGGADVVTLVVPLNNSTSNAMQERLKDLVTKNLGAITAMPQQNALVIVDTAANVRRLRDLITILDAKPAADQEYQVFALRNADAANVFEALKGLIAEKRTTVVIDKDGQRRTVQEENFEGLSIRPDPRTNSIIAVGPKARLNTVEAVVKLLDRESAPGEAGGGGPEMTTFALAAAGSDDAASKVTALFTRDPQAQRPVVISLPGQNKVTVIGTGDQVRRAGTLLSELDPGVSATNGAGAGAGGGVAAPGGGGARVESTAKIIALKHARPEAALSLVKQLLSPRQTNVLRLAALGEQRSVVVSGPAADVAAVEQTLAALDVPPRFGNEVRQVRVGPGVEPGAALKRARELYALKGRAESEPVEAIADAESRTITLAGGRAAVDSFAELLRTAMENAGGGRETRVFSLTRALPSEVAQRLPALARAMLGTGADAGDEASRMRAEGLDGLGRLVVTAEGSQFRVIEELVRALDQPTAEAGWQLRTYRMKRGDVNAAAASVRTLLASGSVSGVSAAQAQSIGLNVDAATRSLLVTAPATAWGAIEGALKQIEGALETPATSLRTFELTSARGDAVAGILRPLLVNRLRERQARGEIPPGIDVGSLLEVVGEPTSNTVIVAAPEEILAAAGELIKTLDTAGDGSRTFDTRVFTLRKARAEAVATALTAGLSAGLRAGEAAPVVRAEPTGNSVVVAARPEKLAKAEELVKQLDESASVEGVGVRTVVLKHARAEALAPLLTQLLRQENVTELIPWWARGDFVLEQRRRGVAPQVPVRIAADTRLNALVLTGPVGLLDAAEEIVSGLDVESAGKSAAGERAIRVMTLKNADATELAASVRALFEPAGDGRAGAGGGGPFGGPSTPADGGVLGAELPPTIRVDKGANALLVRGTAAQLAAIDELVGKLDAATLGASREMRMIPVDRSKGDANAMAAALRRMLEQRGGVKVEVISADELLKREGARDDGAGKGDVKKDEPKRGSWLPRGGGLGGGDPRGVQIAHVVAALVMGAVDEQAGGQAAGNAAEPEPTVTIAVDKATNSLIVVGGSKAIERVANLARELERQMPAEPASVRFVQMPANVDARATANVLSGLVGQIGAAGAQNAGGFTGRVSVQADPDGTGLIVVANETDFAVLRELIGTLASPKAAEQRLTIKAYPLQNVPSWSAIGAVRDLFSQRPTGAQARRVRSLSVTVDGGAGAAGGEPARAVTIDPASVSISTDAAGTSLIVAAPPEAIALLDRFVALIDQSPTSDRQGVRTFAIKNAKASEVARTLQTTIDAARAVRGSWVNQPRFIGDDRTNLLIVTGNEGVMRQAESLLAELDKPLQEDGSVVTILPLQAARPSSVQRLIEAALGARDPARKERISLTALDEANLLVFRAGAETTEEIKKLISQVDKSDAAGLPVRSLKLERADAGVVAQALQRFFADRDRASTRPGMQSRGNRVAIAGDRRSSTLVIAASEEDWGQIKSLVEKFDAPATARDLKFRVVQMEKARVGELRRTLSNLLDEISWRLTFLPAWRGGGQESPDQLVFEFDERTNSVVLIGSGEVFDQAERVVRALDVAPNESAKQVIKAVRVEHADPRVVAQAVRTAINPAARGSWWNPDPETIRIEVDAGTKTLLIVGEAEKVERALGFVKQLDVQVAGDRSIDTIPVKYAAAERVAASVDRFFRTRAEGQGEAARRSLPAVIGSRDGNVVMVSGGKEDLELVKQLVSQMDLPEEGEGRARELFRLRNAEAAEIANTLREQFPRATAARDGLVIVTAQPATNSVLVSAPQDLMERLSALVSELDSPPTDGVTKIVTVVLSTARATELAASLQAALPRDVKIKITPVARTNSLLLTGSDAAIELVTGKIKELDAQPTRQQEFVRVRLTHAQAADVALTLRLMTFNRPAAPGVASASISSSVADNTVMISATPDQLDELRKIIGQLDVPSEEKRKTEFVPLRFADAERTRDALAVFYGRFAQEAQTPGAKNVTIIANPASKSLVISAGEAEWPGIKGLLDKLDNEQYDTSRRLEIIGLRHADAVSLARTLTETFAAPLRAELERERARAQQRPRGGPNDEPEPPRVLVDNKDIVTVSAELQTNSLVVSAGREDLERIRAVVSKLDVPDSARLPEARLIPLRIGPASAIATSLRQTFTDREGGAGARGPLGGPRQVVIVGEDRSNTLIVRAEESAFAQIKAMAETLQQEGDKSRAQVRVLKLGNAPAARVANAVRGTFTNVAREGNEAFAVEVDRAGNALVVASSQKLYEQIEKVAKELDRLGAGEAPADGRLPAGLGQTVQIVDIENNSPAEIVRLVNELGLTRAQAPDRPGVVSEPVTVTALATRRAIAVVGSQQDVLAVAALVKGLDATPAFAEQSVAVVRLKTAAAPRVAAAIESLIRPAAGDANSAPARALLEQVRRLNIQREGGDGPLTLDLSRPVRVQAETQTNSLLLASTKENLAVLRDLAAMLDKLPIGEAVTVRVMPLQAAAATRVAGVIRDLYSQAERLRTLAPGSEVRGEPSGPAGRAVVSAVAISVDERTNALIVAGKEEAIALVEVLVKQLDNEKGQGWIEPSVIPLKHADARTMATILRQVFVEGLRDTPEAQQLQRAVGRIGVVQAGKNPSDPGARIETNLYASLSSVNVVPQEQLNALVVVGSTANVAAMRELIALLDVPAASAGNTVRIYPLQFAAAERVAGMLREIFRQQIASGTIRREDDVSVTPDARTNSLVVSTSGRSFAVVESLLTKLDGELASPSVKLHVVPVPQGNAALLAPKIERLMRDRIDGAQRAGGVASPRDVFSIQAEPASSSLIVAASDENLAIIKQLIEVLSKGAAEVAGSVVVDVIVVKSARVEQLAAALRELYVDKANRERGQDVVRVTPDTRLNAIVVSGTASDIEAIRNLVQRLDGAPVTAVTEIKRIELKRTDAVEVARLLQNVLAGRTIAGGGAVGQRQALLVRFLRDAQARRIEGAKADGPTEAEISGAIQEQVTITPEPRTNSLFVNAPAQLMVLIESLVADLDTTTAGARQIEVFELRNADARAMGQVLRELFNLRQQGNQLVLVPERGTPGIDRAGPPSPNAAGDASAAFFPTLDERQALAITIDARTNSLIVSATSEYLEEVRKVVMRLDNREVNEREALTVRLRNVRAPEAARVLRDYFREESDRVRQLLGPDRVGSLVSQLEREVVVQGDERSNSLLVSVSPRYRETVQKLIEEIDATPPQVLVQVILAEVTLDAAGQFGIEARVGPFGGDAFRGQFLGAGSPISSALGVPNFSVSSVDFELLVRALEAQGRLEVLSRPQMTIRNNEPARFQVGENIGIADSIETFSNGNTSTRVRRENVGIILEVTPSVSQDGFVRMDIRPEISALTDRTTQISENVRAAIISRREISTVVTVKDGETIVLGGLIQNSEEERKTKVPGLGDIPLVGEIFKSSRYTNTKTELLVLVTPRVVRSGEPAALEQLRKLREDEIERLSKTAGLRKLQPVDPPLEEQQRSVLPTTINVVPPAPSPTEWDRNPGGGSPPSDGHAGGSGGAGGNTGGGGGNGATSGAEPAGGRPGGPTAPGTGANGSGPGGAPPRANSGRRR